jgi:hypothetical protein
MSDTIPEVRCPACGRLSWERDGFAVVADGPRVDLERFAPSSSDPGPWACRACGHALEDRDPLGGALTQLQQVHWE